ncbi:MAG: 50S ribosomal protein L6 [Sulfolobales archaeon]|nr:50S ribosomal protein L6 [Sulfolobales archaeon]MCX8186394.1 50S ribosomal protein L6 [Sulfolobales archaeon]MDW7968871.1 50S ribosomal protein L6 [Sulfolobales archaeon]
MVREVLIKESISIPDGVEVSCEGMRVRVKGPKGEIVRDFSNVRNVKLVVGNGKITVYSFFSNRRIKALTYTMVAHIKNMIEGVTRGYRYKLKIVFSHFPVTVRVEGDRVLIENFLGERSPRIAKIKGNVKVSTKGEDVIIEGVDIEDVAQTAANIEKATKIRELDRRVFNDGIFIYERGYADGE